MIDKEICNTTEHVVVEADQRQGRSGRVSLLRTLRQTGLGMVCLAVLSAVLFAFVGPAPGLGVPALALAVVIAVFIFFAASGHKPTCSAKKALILFFGWIEFAF
ncbi:hypothetical protein ACFP3U_18275 [Kitasatospora misakiensis]|uniref:Tripartite tricarboxylate transporter TctB family protein n=1 Tax=Kitasatospora misakiensis TaxID=67330 RepID=A0ABW0X5B1_9ACTN